MTIEVDGEQMTFSQAAKKYGINESTLRNRIGKGVSVERSLNPCSMHRGKKGWAGRKLNRLIEMRDGGSTLQEMADEFGVTRERIRQVLQSYLDETTIYGEGRVGYRSLEECARELHASIDLVGKLLKEDDVLHASGYTFVREDRIDELRNRLDAHRMTRCVVCARPFKRGPHGTKKHCSRKCWNVKRTKYHRNPPKRAYCDWHVELEEQLQDFDPPPGDWQTLGELLHLGLTPMQIIWLGKKGIVTVSPHPTERWRGQPVRRYRHSEIALAAEIYKKHATT